jgi:predicted DNA-binding protein (MmcQ/YjbR family)
MSESNMIAVARAALDARPGAAWSEFPTARGVALYKVVGKLFAILEDRKAQYLIVKCDPHMMDILKEQYAGVGHRTHLDRRFWICINLDGDVPEDEMVRLIESSYALVCAGLNRKQKAELAALA